MAVRLTARRSVVVISDWVDGPHRAPRVRRSSGRTPCACDRSRIPAVVRRRRRPRRRDRRLSRAAAARLRRRRASSTRRRSGIIGAATGRAAVPPRQRRCSPAARSASTTSTRRSPRPRCSASCAAFGAPHILVVLGLGVAPDAARRLREQRHHLQFDRRAGAARAAGGQRAFRSRPDRRAVAVGRGRRARHPGMRDRDHADRPGIRRDRPVPPARHAPRTYDLIYVAAAQPYKRHDILFDALARLPRDVRALCVFGYGEMADDAARARRRARTCRSSSSGRPACRSTRSTG